MEVFEADVGEDVDDGFDALEELRQIQHQHSKLLKEKQGLEHLNQDLEQQSDEHQQSLDKVNEQNKTLSALVRHLANQCREYSDYVAELQEEIERANIKLPDRLVIVADDTIALEQKVSKVLSSSNSSNSSTTYADTLQLLHEEITLLKSQVSKYQHEVHRLRIETSTKRKSDDGGVSAEALAAMKEQMASIELETELEASRQREALLEKQLQELLQASHTRQATFESEQGQLHQALIQSQEHVQILTDRMDELRHQVEEARLESMSSDNLGAELSMADELSPHLSHKLTPEEESKILRELAELRVQSQIYHEEMSQSKLVIGNLQGCYYKMLAYAVNRETTLIKTIRQPPKKAKRAALLAWLADNTLQAAFDEAYAAVM